MEEFICVLRPKRLGMVTHGPTPEETRVISAHFEYWSEKYKDKTIRVVGRTQNNDENTFGVVIFSSENQERAKLIVQADPAVFSNIMTAEVLPFRVALG